MAKVCIRCGIGTEFYTHERACKSCRKSAVRANYKANRKHYVAYDKKREKKADRKIFKAAAQRKYRINNPIKNKARGIVNRALRSGKIKRKPCSVCGATKVHAHHTDYTKPLDVVWLCNDHHWDNHR